jgi:hypothetical protein
MKVDTSLALQRFQPADERGSPFANHVKQPSRVPIAVGAKSPPGPASNDKILRALLDVLEQPGVPADQALRNLQASLLKPNGGLNQVCTLERPGEPDRLATGLPRSQMRELESRYFDLNKSSGKGFNAAFEQALLAKIRSFSNGGVIAARYETLRDETFAAARAAFPNDPKRAAAAASAAMVNGLFFMLNPRLELPPGICTVNDCNAIIQRSADKHGRVNERVVGLVPKATGGAGPGPIPLKSDISKDAENALYVHNGW